MKTSAAAELMEQMVPTWAPESMSPPPSDVSQIWKKDHQIPQEAKNGSIVTEP